jgi:exodeoxyribonuclease VII large subunit
MGRQPRTGAPVEFRAAPALGLPVIEGGGGTSRRNVWTVAALVHEVAELVGRGLGACTVRGEISGFSRAASGHCYFSLEGCRWRRRADALRDVSPQRQSVAVHAVDGQLVEVRGRVGVYEPRGELQFIARPCNAQGTARCTNSSCA